MPTRSFATAVEWRVQQGYFDQSTVGLAVRSGSISHLIYATKKPCDFRAVFLAQNSRDMHTIRDVSFPRKVGLFLSLARLPQKADDAGGVSGGQLASAKRQQATLRTWFDMKEAAN
jgi:hypothetical protein